MADSLTSGAKLSDSYGGKVFAAEAHGRGSSLVASSAVKRPQNPPFAWSAGRPHVTAAVAQERDPPVGGAQFIAPAGNA